MPLYFVLVGQTKNGSDLCYPKDKVAQDGEVLKLLEKVANPFQMSNDLKWQTCVITLLTIIY